MTQQNIQLWIEGYRVMEAAEGAKFCGEFEASTLKEAVTKYGETLTEQDREVNLDLERLTYWGCKFFDNEQEARKVFG